MDIHDVTNHYARSLDIQRENLEKAKRCQGQRLRELKSREDAYIDFMQRLSITSRLTSAGPTNEHHEIYPLFLLPAYPPCIAPVAELRRVKIRGLQLETHHRGTYLLLRSIAPPSCTSVVMALMEDEDGDVIEVHLYHREHEENCRAADIVGVDTILLVKEPYFNATANGGYVLRVDHLSDVVRVDDDDARIPVEWQPRLIEIDRSAESLKEKGNLAMRENKYWDAVKEYSYALRQPATADEIEIIKRNRSLAFLKIKQFDAALSDTGFPNFKTNPPEKALFRAAEALYNLERFRECCEVLELLLASFPDNKRAIETLNRARSRCQEQESGVYNFKQLQAKARTLEPPHLDHATYVGPVEVRQTESKGRGLFVTKAVEAGELLLCEKAFSYAYADDKCGSRTTTRLNVENDRGFMSAHSDLFNFTIQKLYRNPSVSRAFTTLYHGTYEGVTTPAVDAEPIVDTFLVDRIISFNIFGCPVSSLTSHNDSLANKGNTERAYLSCGIWTRASYINHSCIATARGAFIGDMMIVRAACDMEPGTEITFQYHCPQDRNVKGLPNNLSYWAFVCDCALCLDAKTTEAAVITERQTLEEKLKKLFDSPAPSSSLRTSQIGEIERLLEALNNTYVRPADEVPRLMVWGPQLTLAYSFAGQNNMIKSLESVGKVLTALGFIVVGADSSRTRFAIVKWGMVMDHLVQTFLHAEVAFLAIGARKDSMQAHEYAKISFKIVVGEDRSFAASYG